MPRRHENLTRHNILLHAGDLAWIQETYPGMGAAAIIRTLIQRHRLDIEKAVDAHAPLSNLAISRRSL
jgi:hypothetical protein